jgi:hypothetical protein
MVEHVRKRKTARARTCQAPRHQEQHNTDRLSSITFGYNCTIFSVSTIRTVAFEIET